MARAVKKPVKKTAAKKTKLPERPPAPTLKVVYQKCAECGGDIPEKPMVRRGEEHTNEEWCSYCESGKARPEDREDDEDDEEEYDEDEDGNDHDVFSDDD